MVALSNQGGNCQNKAIRHEEFLKRIKKTFYYGPSNPNCMISHPLAQQVAARFTAPHKNFDLRVLDLPTISKMRQQTPCSLILSMIYVDRLLKCDPAYVRSITPSDLLLVTLMVSTKFYSDYDETEVFMSNWADEGDVSMERLKQLEIQFLNAIQWNLLVSENEFYEQLKIVERLMAMKEGLARNWFTYTEMDMLMPTIETAKQILNYTTILMFSYACSVLTIALSCIIATSIPMPLSTPPTTTIVSRGCDGNVTVLPNDVISMNDVDLTECTYINEALDDDNDLRFSNFTYSFLVLNRMIEIPMKRNYNNFKNFHFEMLHVKPNPSRLYI